MRAPCRDDPERTTSIILSGGYARRLTDVDYPAGLAFLSGSRNGSRSIEAGLGHKPVGIEDRAPSMAHDARYREAYARYLRLAASPAAVVALVRMNAQIDVRPILGSIRVPTLVLHRVDDRTIPIEAGRYLAAHIPGARSLSSCRATTTCLGWAMSTGSSAKLRSF